MTLTPLHASPEELTPAIGYIRVSMAREEMISPELQRAAILSWAARTRHRIIDWVEDLDKTGRNFKRKIVKVIERVERGDAKVIAVWKYSRFGRNRPGIELNLARIEQAGGHLLSATEEVDATTATGWFQRDVLFSVAAFESMRSGEQWREVQESRRLQGLPSAGRSRFGYIWHPRKIHQPDGSFTLQDERYELDANQAEALVAAYTKYVAGEGFYAIAMQLNDSGHRTVRGNLWYASAIQRYMDSGFAAGYLRFHQASCPEKSFPHDCDNYDLVRHPENAHPSAISDQLWKQYLERRNFTKNAPPRSRSAQYPLTGLCRCKSCDGPSTRHVRKNRDPRYVCMRRKEKGALACVGSGATVTTIMTAVKAFLAALLPQIEAAAEETVIPAQRTVETREGRLAAVEANLTKLDNAINRHMRVYAMADDEDGTLEASYLSTLKELRASRAALVGERSRLEDTGQVVTPQEMRASLVPVVESLLVEWDTLEPAAINVLLRRIVARVEIGKDEEVGVVAVWDEG